MDGVLVIAKPAGPTSHDVVGLVRRLSATKRVGHGGTLDPFASGVLPVFLGKATRLVEYHLHDRKRYRATVCFGASSTTDDLEGALTPAVGPAPERAAVEELRGLLQGPGTEFAADVRDELQEQMSDLCGIIRNEEGLSKLQGILGELHERYERVGVQDHGRGFNTELMEAVELGFLLDVSDTVVAAARTRDESRGGHYREDHPLREDDRWLVHSLSYRDEDGSVRMEYKDVVMGPYIPMERKY